MKTWTTLGMTLAVMFAFTGYKWLRDTFITEKNLGRGHGRRGGAFAAFGGRHWRPRQLCDSVLGLMCAFAIAAHLLLLGHLPARAQSKTENETAMPGEIWGSNITIEDNPCCGASGEPPEDHSDLTMIANMAGKASRDGKVLRLRVDAPPPAGISRVMGSRRTLKITDCTEYTCDADKVRSHRLVGWWPERQYYVIDVGTYEGELAYLIRERDGLVIRTAAPPERGPDNRYAIAIGDLHSSSATGIEVLDLQVDPPWVIGRYPSTEACSKIDDIGPAKWTSPTEVVFERATFFGYGSATPRPGHVSMRIVTSDRPELGVGGAVWHFSQTSAEWQCSN